MKRPPGPPGSARPYWMRRAPGTPRTPYRLPWSIIHRGHLAAEFYENGATPDTTFNVYSCSKSFTGTAYGILFGASFDAPNEPRRTCRPIR